MILGRFFTKFSDFLGRVHGPVWSPKKPQKKIAGVVPHEEVFFCFFGCRVHSKNELAPGPPKLQKKHEADLPSKTIKKMYGGGLSAQRTGYYIRLYYVIVYYIILSYDYIIILVYYFE